MLKWKSKRLNAQHFFVWAACVQESFSASGCLETLTLTLVRLTSAADVSFLSCQLSVIISTTLSACITDNSAYCSQTRAHHTLKGIHLNNQSIPFFVHNLLLVAALASGLAQYGMVSRLFSLLACQYLDPEDGLPVLLCLGLCTEASGEAALFFFVLNVYSYLHIKHVAVLAQGTYW